MPEKEATARIKINKLLEAAGWRFFPQGSAPANIRLEPSVTIKSTDLDALGEDFEKTTKGFVDFLSFKTLKEQEYIEFLWDAFETNYTHGKYQFAFLAYHVLTMSFVYFNIWQIKQTEPKDFAMGLIGFGKDIEKSLLEATSPFVFSTVNERTILRFLKLIACDNAKIGTYIKLVDDRNDTAHSNGNIFFSTQAALDAKVNEILRVVDEIQTHSKPVIEHAYREFLLRNHDPEEREYPDAADQIREVLVHNNYLSQMDIDICLGFDIQTLRDYPNFSLIEGLHHSLCRGYAEPDEAAA